MSPAYPNARAVARHIIAQAEWGLHWHRERLSGRWPQFDGAYAHNQHMSAMHIMAMEAASL